MTFALVTSFSLKQLKMIQVFVKPTQFLTSDEQMTSFNELLKEAIEKKTTIEETTLTRQQMQQREQRDELRDECDRSGGQ